MTERIMVRTEATLHSVLEQLPSRFRHDDDDMWQSVNELSSGMGFGCGTLLLIVTA